jgi:epoxyqueuosine reductase
MDPAATAALLKDWALEEGFDRAGVARLEPAHTGPAFLAWLERGDDAGMGYLRARAEERLDPRSLMPGAKSALCVAQHYAPLDDPGLNGSDLWPRVARYARGRDYHNRLGKKLSRLARRIEAGHAGHRARAWVDTGPILERELAAKAGLGSVGKNTVLLHPEAGSWFVLGEILTTLSLEPDDPLADLCGSCTRCLDACPTGALPGPYRLDSNRCISYWTIEHRGEIPEPMRSNLEGWVFGCDICQEVCPWNEAPEVEVVDDFLVPEGRRRLRLADIVRLNDGQYRQLFNGSPIQRARLDGLQRNVRHVLDGG